MMMVAGLCVSREFIIVASTAQMTTTGPVDKAKVIFTIAENSVTFESKQI